MKKEFIYILLFLYGFSALIVQTLLLREYIVQFLGSELSIALVFFAWFLGIAFGAIAYNLLSRLRVSNFAKLAFAFVLLFSGVFISSFARAILKLPVGELVSTAKLVIASLIFVFPSGFGVGMSFPTIAVIIYSYEIFKHSTSLWSAIFGVEALGSLCAGVLFPLVLVQMFDPLTLATLTMTCAFFALALLIAHVNQKKFTIALLLITFACLIACIIKFGDLTMGILRGYLYRTMYPSQEVIAKVETPYKRIELTESKGQFNLYADGQILTSFPDERRHALFSHMLMCLHPDPRRVLFFGGGIEGVAQHALLHHLDKLDVVMLDKREVGLIEYSLNEAKLGLPKDKRFNLEIDDYVLYVKRALKDRMAYDLAVVFGSSPSTASSNRLYTLDFLKNLCAILSEDGVAVLPILGSENYAGALISLTIASITKTLLIAGFEEVTIVPGETLLIVSAKKDGVLPKSDEDLIARYKYRGISDPIFVPEALFGTISKQRVSAIINQVEPFLATAKINSDYNPIAYLLQLLFLDKIAGGSLEVLFGFSKAPVKPAVLEAEKLKLAFKKTDIISKKTKINYLPVFVALLFLFLIYILFSKRADKLGKGAVLYAILTTGLCGMSFEIIVIYLYQARFGILYQNVSLLVASYMLGLTLGAFVFKFIKVERFRGFLLLEVALVLAVLSLVLARYIQAPAPWFFFMLVIFGALSGFQLALGGAILQEGFGVSRSASRIEAIDHLGAMMGSLATGILIMPIFGMLYAIFALAILKLTSMLAILAVSSRYRG